jgi:hypothetical protein
MAFKQRKDEISQPEDKLRIKIEYIDVVDKILVPHCARGPKRCEECKKAAEEEKICLIRVYLESGSIARPMSDFILDGKKKIM